MQPVPGLERRAGVVIPIRAFRSGKVRLADVLSSSERADLAEAMANRVVGAAGDLPLVIVSSAPEVREWARALDVDVIDDRDGGLDAAARAGLDHHRGHGRDRVIVAHADLPRAEPGSLEWFDRSEPGIVTIVPCHRDDGTPVMSIPTHADSLFAYGPGSARRHAARARAAGLAVRVVRNSSLAFDVDLPEDLATS
ncbi:MAG: 2-phospho-L-lactate guanylyltransferase [Acidimicrobiia bacterium]|nr:2-phospho-L-lactate guanylyltransferase [Acidimicrobiia bacterium]